MLIISLISWWYTDGLRARSDALNRALARTADAFSISLLLRTLANPFRQIDADSTGKGPAASLQALLSRLLSRLIGIVARTVLILIGLIVLFCQSLLSAIIIILHILIPLAPIAGIILMLIAPEIHLW